MATSGPKVVQDLLSRAHSPDSVSRIYSEKIQHRTLRLRPSSPPPASLNARAARRKARQDAKSKGKLRPKPLSSRERRRLGLYDVPKEGQKYELYEPLHKLWMGYALELLGDDVFTGGPSAAAKLASAEFHGAEVEVVRSRCTGRVGIKGIVVRDLKFVMQVVTKKRGLKTVPKEGTTFRIEVDAPEDAAQAQAQTQSQAQAQAQGVEKKLAFEVLGDQLMLRSADRANRKFKTHFLRNI